jgi:enamine deaminase RidA (YjgF/YER057c/UK114 family)
MADVTRRELGTLSASVLGAIVIPRVGSEAEAADQRSTGEPTMSIQRHVIIEPSSGKPFTSVSPIISYATVDNGLVYLAGITADPEHLGDVKDQTSQVLARIDRLLKVAGTDKSKLLSATVWLTDMSLFVAHNEVWNKWVDASSPPVRACLHSSQLWYPGMLVEIMVTAAK